MKILAILLCVLLTFSSCAPALENAPADLPELLAHAFASATPAVLATPATPGETPDAFASPGILEEAPPEPEIAIETVYVPYDGMTVEQIVEAYFEQMYLSYTELVYIDVSSLLDMTNSANRNMLKWTEMLIQRRKLLQETGLCPVDTEKRPYTVEFDEIPEDDRMELWRDWLAETGNEVIHFRVRGESGMAYPPIMAVNSQHSMFFQEIDGEVKIILHYFPGSVRKFTDAGNIKVPDEYVMLNQLEEEFARTNFLDTDDAPVPDSFKPYDAEKAVEYAFEFTESPNPDFYDIGDWIGNCANFVSQCVWAGYGSEAMTAQWYGGDGGTIAWENVNSFWECITSGRELRGDVLESAGELQNGDIIQLRTASIKGEENRFTHTLLVVDESTMMLAQNSPACFVYYSDLVNVKTRAIRPAGILGQ